MADLAPEEHKTRAKVYLLYLWKRSKTVQGVYATPEAAQRATKLVPNEIWRVHPLLDGVWETHYELNTHTYAGEPDRFYTIEPFEVQE